MKSESIGKFSKLRGSEPSVQVSSKNEFLALTLKNYAKADVNGFWSCPTLLDCINFFQNILNKIIEMSRVIFLAQDGMQRLCPLHFC